jgi:hypothetical protein
LTDPNTCLHVGYQGVDRTWSTRGHIDANDPGCVKTPRHWYDSSVILGGGFDEALR